jgi:hypothetical protein
MVLMLGLAGGVYAAGGMQTPTQSPDAKKEHAGCCNMHKQGDGQSAAQACAMKKDSAAANCCAPGAACCQGKGSACCEQHKKTGHDGHEQVAAGSSAKKHGGAAGCCASCEHCAKMKEKAEGTWSVRDDATILSANAESSAAKGCCAADAGKSACTCCQHTETAEK